MNSIFSDIDHLIEQAVAKATETEKSLQKKQEKNVKKKGLEAEKEDETETESEKTKEAEDDDKNDSGDESIKKIKGKSSDAESSSTKSSDKEKSGKGETPGTKTSKKLNDPSSKVISNPKFSDVKDKVNALRGSGSLADEKVAGSVQAYLKKLSPAEKSALLTYLTNLSQIMATVKSPEDVKNPDDVGIKITFSGKKKDKAKPSPQKSNDSGVIVVGGK